MKWIFALILLTSTLCLQAVNTQFSFNLDEPCNTSAAVYALQVQSNFLSQTFITNQVEIRTLWSKSSLSAGTYTSNFDGFDDFTNALPVGSNIVIKVLENNVLYKWDGAIGNSSSAQFGNTVHTGFHFLHDMAISGTNMYFVRGYDEGKLAFSSAYTWSPTNCSQAWFWMETYPGAGNSEQNPVNIYDRNWDFVCSDSNWIYDACTATFNPASTGSNAVNNAYAGCIVAANCTNFSSATFTSGYTITNNPGLGWNPGVLPNGVYVGTIPGLSGMDVQQTGSLLAICNSNANTIYLVDKHSGSTLQSWSAPCPGRCSWSPDGSLWVCSSNSIIQYTNATATTIGVGAQTNILTLSHPEGISVNPTNGNQILVADGGTNQQVKMFATNGTLTWVYGLQGGYQTNGPAITTNKFWFDLDGYAQGFVRWAGDGTWWVSDADNHRAMHFNGSQAYLEQIVYQPYSYKSSVDLNNPSHVFNQWLEFQVNYNQSLGQSWILVTNWCSNVDTNHIDPTYPGLYNVVTLTNGRTYALIYNGTNINISTYNNNHVGEICELTGTGLRFTGIYPFNALAYTNQIPSFDASGNAWCQSLGSSTIYERLLTNFDGSNNPQWGAASLVGLASQNSLDPYYRFGGVGYGAAAQSTNAIYIQNDPSLNAGFHLGGIASGTTNWLWRAEPSGPLNGAGNYDIGDSITYGGDMVACVDRNIIAGYHGEFYLDGGGAGQFMQYLDDGLFVGQFGEANPGHQYYEQPVQSVSDNGFCINFIQTNGEYYVWHNDENSHGPQRWHLINVRNIRENWGAGIVGTSIIITNQPFNFPSNLKAFPLNNSCLLSWNSVSGAYNYNIYYTTNNGGPYILLSDSPRASGDTITGLINGMTYYFVISAVVGGIEGIKSEQVSVTPYDTTQFIIATGQASEGELNTIQYNVSSNALSLGLPSLQSSTHYTGNFTVQDRDNYDFGHLWNENIGYNGFALYDFGGVGTNFIFTSTNFSIGAPSGWINRTNIIRTFSVDGNTGYTNVVNAMAGYPNGTINITVTDTNWHYLTVECSAIIYQSQNFSIGMTSTNGSSVQYNESQVNGYSYLFQFMFRGNASVWATDTSGTYTLYEGGAAIIQGLFFDNVNAIPIAPPIKNALSFRLF